MMLKTTENCPICTFSAIEETVLVYSHEPAFQFEVRPCHVKKSHLGIFVRFFRHAHVILYC